MKANIAIFLTLLLPTLGAGLSGKWSGTFRVEGGDHDVPQLFILQQDGPRLSGSGGPNEGEQYPIENAHVDGDRVTFELTTGEWKFSYRLTISGRRLTGDLELKSLDNRRSARVSMNKID